MSPRDGPEQAVGVVVLRGKRMMDSGQQNLLKGMAVTMPTENPVFSDPAPMRGKFNVTCRNDPREIKPPCKRTLAGASDAAFGHVANELIFFVGFDLSPPS
ncbi:hypothetical protein [Paracoccus seriniphilus]|uniref:hypothetical protein n=1 Tax=Paracoccus seriniphilus TaxID=184748 RepID=UPI001FEBCD52|nr:hypothetical protein [Paracoccus seriniphilus]